MSNLSTITTNILADSGIDDINVIVSTASYNNPSWITALSWTKITGTPTFVSSVGLSMPSAFNVANSPVTGSGTIVVTGAGNATQYVRGDGVLATLPTSGEGGGSSVSYYLNGSINQGTIGGVTYYQMNKTPIIGAGTDFSTSSNGYIASFLTNANDPALLKIPSGNWNFETYFSSSSGGGSPSFYIELYKYDGTTFSLIASNSGSPRLINDGTTIEAYFSTLAVPETTLTVTDRFAIRIYVTTSGRTITLHTENGQLCQVITTFTTGLTALNGLTSQVQFFAIGTSGTNFNISSVTDTHTFNLPTASATNRGALASSDWTTFNNKENAIIAGTTAQYYRGDKTFQTLNTSVVPELTNLYFTQARVSANTDVAANTAARHAAVTLGTANGLTLSTQQLSLGLASSSQTGALSSTDWNTFNDKANTNGSNATGSWGIDITGNAATAISAETWTTPIVLTIGGTGRSLNGSTNLSWTLGEIGAQAQLNGTGFVKASGTTITYDNSTYYLASNPDNFTSNLGTVTSVDLSAPTGFVVSNNPITTSGTIALAFASGYSLPTNAVQSDWTTAYNDSIVSAAVTGTATKTLTLNQQDGGTITASWTDIDTAPVTSVFGRTGDVVAASGDYNTSLVTENTNLYFTDARARAAISLTTTGTSGAATYDSVAGVFNIPNYAPDLTGYVTLNTAQTITGAKTFTSLLTGATGSFASSGSTNTFTINHSSGSGIGLNITKSGNNETLLVTKTSGSGNAMAVVGGRTALVDLSLSSVSNATGNFLTISGGLVHQRTAAETRSDIGAQAQLNGTGFVKASGTTISYDNSTYLTTAAAASTYLPLTGGTLTGALGGTSANFSSSVTAGGDVIAFSSSDRRLKDKITSIKNPLQKINKIGGYSFTWNNNQDTYLGNDYGVVAQEIEEIFPELVINRDNGYKAVKYEKLIPLLIESIKELSKQVEILKQK
jgi:hypothetical protein